MPNIKHNLEAARCNAKGNSSAASQEVRPSIKGARANHAPSVLVLVHKLVPPASVSYQQYSWSAALSFRVAMLR